MGIIMAGGIFSAANPALTGRELAHQLRDSGACYLLVAEASLDTAVEAARLVGLPLDRIKYFDADFLMDESNCTKENLKGVGYWDSLFASEQEGKSYQWDELKGVYRPPFRDTLLICFLILLQDRTKHMIRSWHSTTPLERPVSLKAL